MAIYDKPTKVLMLEFANQSLSTGQVFSKPAAVDWFKKNFPKIRHTTVEMHVEAMAVNSRARKHHRNAKPGSGHDLFFKVGPGKFRLWDPNYDPQPIYANDLESVGKNGVAYAEKPETVNGEELEIGEGSGAFAYENDLRNYLSKNLGALESGLRLYQDEDITGVQFPAGGRFIDILAMDEEENFVVIELKVSRGYDRTIGQILRYMGWVEQNMADGKKVRGVIVAKEITEDLKLAASRMPDIQLAEYEISFNLKPIS